MGWRADRSDMLADPVLVLVDLQKDFCKPGFAFDIPDRDLADIPSTLEATSEFLERYRATGRSPVLVRTEHEVENTSKPWIDKYDEEPMPCEVGTEGAEFVPELDAQESDVVVTKHRYSGFHGTPLDTYLRSNDITHLLVGGANTNVCVASTVHGAFNRDYQVTILEDCTATTQPKYHDAHLDSLVDNNFATAAPSSDIALESL